MEIIQLTINNKIIFVQPHASVLQACEAANVDVPRFCYHEKLSVAGNCRICLVEVLKSPKPVVACAIPVAKGIVIFTDTPLVRKARESVLEFLLLNHPLDCPICDQGGECDLQDESLTYGSDRSRYFFDFKRSVEDKECGPIVKTVITRCIHCTRCVRFSSEIAGNEIMGSFGRGEETEIGTYVQSFIKTELSGNLIDLCPVGALTSKPYAYKGRNWEINRTATIDIFDSIASDIIVCTRNQTNINKFATESSSIEKIIIIIPIKNGKYIENWISDRTRFAFDGLYSIDRNNTSKKQQNWNTNNKNDTFSIFTINANSSIINFIFGSQTNLETIFSVDVYIKLIDNNSFISQDIYTSKLILDIPFFYSLNKSFNSFSTKSLKNRILIGTNTRYEVSLLNTVLRREYKQRGSIYITIGAFSPLAFTQMHMGISTRSLINLVENRSIWIKNFIKASNTSGIYISVNIFRNTNAIFRQKLITNLGKYFFVKNNVHNRFGWIHDSVGSLAFAHINCYNKIVNNNKLTNILCFINKQSSHNNYYNAHSIITISTHYDNNADFNSIIPSFYESNGHIISIDNSILNYNKVVTPITSGLNNEYPISIESQLNNIISKWLILYYKWGNSLEKFKKQVCYISIKNDSTFFNFNPFFINSFFENSGKLILFVQPINDFYRQEQIAAQSSIIAECSMFLKPEINKNNFFIENL